MVMAATTSPTHFWGRVRWWWRCREWRTALFWAPAVLIATGIAGIAGMCLNTPNQELEARYLSEAKSAFQAKDYARALTCYERIAPNANDRPEVLYRLALTAEAMGDYARVATLMRELAPDGGKGYPPAHFWRARQILNANAQAPQALAAAEAHLLKALDGELDERPAVHGSLGIIYLNAGRLDEAELYLSKAAATSKEFQLPYAMMFAARNNMPRFKQEAEIAVRFYRDKARSDPTNIRAQLRWADAVTTVEDYPAAVEILTQGLASTDDPIVYRMAIARVYLAWYEARKKVSGVSAAELISLIDKGLNQDPTNKDLLQRLIDQLRYGGEGADQGRKLLLEMLAKGGTALAPIHFALAVDARLRGDSGGEKLHLDQAYQLDPKSGRIANNLAWVLSQPPNADLPRALALISAPLEREPNNPVYRDTRGRIYMAMERWKDALSDLEVILANAPGTSGLHSSLAEIYDKLGQPALAAEHRKIDAESNRKKQGP
jgi:tetratricopeptide (TPR) repeat protein